MLTAGQARAQPNRRLPFVWGCCLHGSQSCCSNNIHEMAWMTDHLQLGIIKLLGICYVVTNKEEIKVLYVQRVYPWHIFLQCNLSIPYARVYLPRVSLSLTLPFQGTQKGFRNFCMQSIYIYIYIMRRSSATSCSKKHQYFFTATT